MNRRPRLVNVSLVRLVCRLGRDRRAATAIEYGLIVSLVVISMIAAFTSFANTTTGMWNNVSDRVQNPR